MDEQMAAAPAAEFTTAQIDAVDEASMVVMVGGKPTSWVWRFAGPGHPKTIEQGNRLSRERLALEAAQEQARVNGKKWKAEAEAVDDVRKRNVDLVVERLLGWSPVRIDGADLPFSPEAARKFLSDPRKQAFLSQALEFLGGEQSFTARSATS